MTRSPRAFDPEAVALRLAAGDSRRDRLTHLEVRPARGRSAGPWPAWAAPRLVDALPSRGVASLWSHQSDAAELAWSGRHVVVATGTASGKSLAYLLPTLSAIARSVDRPGRAATPSSTCRRPRRWRRTSSARWRGSTCPGVRPTTYDGDSTREERDWARNHANYLLTNPDMLHRTMLPSHARWSPFWGSLRYVVIDECHHYRGVFGAHVAQILRRLRRVAAHYGADPTFVLASATAAEPGVTASRLTGVPVEAIDVDGSPRGQTAVALWEPPLTAARRRARSAGSPLGVLRGRRPGGRPGGRRRAHPGVRAQPSRRRDRRHADPGSTARGRSRPGPAGGALPRRLPARGPARARAAAQGAATCSRCRRPTRSSSASTSTGSTRS